MRKIRTFFHYALFPFKIWWPLVAVRNILRGTYPANMLRGIPCLCLALQVIIAEVLFGGPLPHPKYYLATALLTYVLGSLAQCKEVREEARRKMVKERGFDAFMNANS